jgi:formylglycine-generating enzyme required for sulfatase activity/tRNA A-37 threonylcarbamoyl transferase component Bud32
MASSSLAAGTVLMGKYRIERVLGQGAMGTVYVAVDQLTQMPCALKAMRPELRTDSELRRRFVQEFRLSLQLHHRSIVRVYTLEECDGVLFFTMELLEGETLRARLRREGRVDLAEAIRLLTAVCEALDHAHHWTVHRDVKPENIFLTRDGAVKLTDFGIAKALESGLHTQASASMGTAYYMSPEQLRGTGELDARADLYAVGVLLYELLTGELPVPGAELPSSLVAELASDVDELFKRLVARLERRIPSASEVLEALRALAPAGWARIPAGRFYMGSPEGEVGRDSNEVQHEVVLAQSFWLKRTPVTQGEWNRLMGNQPAHFVRSGEDAPVEQVTWYDAIAYCNALSRAEGLEPCYVLSEESGVSGEHGLGNEEDEEPEDEDEAEEDEEPEDEDEAEEDEEPEDEDEAEDDDEDEANSYSCVVHWKRDAVGYRLPTEAEWEYACRAGCGGPFNDGTVTPEEVAWFKENADDRTHPVGQKRPNAWGLFDMHGNVWEWVWDWFGDYPEGRVVAPTGPGTGTGRVERGGSWGGYAGNCRSANRVNIGPGSTYSDLGFRPARSLP